MLARTGEALFWTGRHLERAENTARLLDDTYHRLVESRSPDDAAAWGDLMSLIGDGDAKAKAKAIQDRYAKAAELEAAMAARAKAESRKEAAKVAGYDPDVLERLAGDAEFEVKEVKTGPANATKTSHTAYIRVGDRAEPLSAYAERTWPKFLASLKVQAATTTTPTVPSRQAQKPPATPVEHGHATADGAGVSRLCRF